MKSKKWKRKRSAVTAIFVTLVVCALGIVNLGMGTLKLSDAKVVNQPAIMQADLDKNSSRSKEVSDMSEVSSDTVSTIGSEPVTSMQSDDSSLVSTQKQTVKSSDNIKKWVSTSTSLSNKITSKPPVSSSSAPTSSTPTKITPPTFIHPSKIVVGYYGGWAAYSGHTPEKINVTNINILHYAFAKIAPDLKVTASDANIDYINFAKLKLLKNANPNLKTVISIGGWTDSGRFSDAALTQTSRAIFANSAVSFMKTYGFDGIDIDWEYPTGGGLAYNITRTVDKTNFGLLLHALKTKLYEQGIKDNKYYTLSFAGGANYNYASGVGLSNIAKNVDYAIIMTYDLHGGWDTYTDFNSPLYAPAGPSPQYKTSVDTALTLWLSHGFPANKIVLGVPFYGYAFHSVANADNGLWQRFTSTTSIGYDTIKSKYLNDPTYQKYYDATAQVPWLFNGTTFISYDDDVSIQRKAQYAVSKNLLGVGAWEVSYDKNGTLTQIIKTTLYR